MIKTLVIEDQPYIRARLVKLINDLDKDLLIVGECGSVSEAVITAKSCKPDLVFLDIDLGDGSAFDFLSQMETIDFKIIFTTSYDEYAIQALKVGAVDYILKPVEVEELEIAIEKAIKTNMSEGKKGIKAVQKEWQDESNRLILRLHDSFHVIRFNELMYGVSDKGYTTFYLANGKKIMASKSLKNFEDDLDECKFYRIHKSYFVNLDFIDKYDRKGYVILKDGTEIPVSSRKKDEFLIKFLGEK